MLRSVFSLALIFLTLGVVSAADTATLKVQVVFDGDAPKAKDIKPNKDKEFCGKNPIKDDTFVVDPATKAIRDVVLYVYAGRRGTDLKDLGKFEMEKTTVELDNDKCRFEPHVVVTKVGDTLRIKNSDDVSHNAKVSFFKNKEINPTIAAKAHVDVDLEKPESAGIPVECSIHPWMKAYVFVLEHPFADVSNAKGEIEIKGLPAGKDLVFRVFNGGLRTSKIVSKKTGKEIPIKRASIQLKLEPGMNDLGVWELSGKVDN